MSHQSWFIHFEYSSNEIALLLYVLNMWDKTFSWAQGLGKHILPWVLTWHSFSSLFLGQNPDQVYFYCWHLWYICSCSSCSSLLWGVPSSEKSCILQFWRQPTQNELLVYERPLYYGTKFECLRYARWDKSLGLPTSCHVQHNMLQHLSHRHHLLSTFSGSGFSRLTNEVIDWIWPAVPMMLSPTKW